MKNNLAQRLENALMQYKSAQPNKLLPALKSDLRDILREYAELNGDIDVEILENDDGYEINLIGNIKRFKG